MARVPTRFTLVLSWLLAAGVVIAIASSDGPGALLHGLRHMQPLWLLVALGAELAAYAGYVVAYRSAAHLSGAPPPGWRLTVSLVVAGFGPFVALGGFSMDRQALTAVHGDERAARVHVLALGVIEYALLAPAAWAAALALFITGEASPALTLPWIVAVPPGFLVAILFSSPGRVERWAQGTGRLREFLSDVLTGIHALRQLMLHPGDHLGAVLGMGLYWAAEIGCLGAALLCFGVHISVAALVLAHATGYAANRRSLPLGGAGVTEFLLTLALIWVHVPAAPALLSVVAYRAVNFLAPTIPARIAHGSIRPLLNEQREMVRRRAHAARERVRPRREP